MVINTGNTISGNRYINSDNYGIRYIKMTEALIYLLASITIACAGVAGNFIYNVGF